MDAIEVMEIIFDKTFYFGAKVVKKWHTDDTD
jgi:hypothetical protein